MDQKAIVKLCKELGCCDACALRYIGLKNPAAYENSSQFILKYLDQEQPSDSQKQGTDNPSDTASSIPEENNGSNDTSSKPEENNGSNDTSSISEENNGSNDTSSIPEEKNGSNDTSSTPEKNNGSNDTSSILEENDSSNGPTPPSKRRKVEACTSCLGVLQLWSWDQCCELVKEQLDKKQYACPTFACALSAPLATLLREKHVTLTLADKHPEYDSRVVTPLKEAWKWSFGVWLSGRISRPLHSGAVCPLLITVTVDYPDDLQELEVLKTLAASLFESRSKQKRRFTVELTRRSVEQALEGATLPALSALRTLSPPAGRSLTCASVMCTHTPLYLGGRYIKLSRSLPQSPWLVGGARMMESSVQEIIFQPIADLYKMSPEDAEHRLKFISAGREDVDVRCLGDGRPFAIEIADPHRELTAAELQRACDEISRGGKVRLKQLVPVTKEDLALLKKGEEFKTKTYEALCVKLTPSAYDEDKDGPPTVTERDIANINTYRNTPPDAEARVVLKQKTPIRVLHRRPLLDRTRSILQLSARLVPGHPSLFVVRVSTEAGTYIKEWAHGELRRSRPPLGDALEARVDILALDVANVHLDWPPTKSEITNCNK